MKFPTFASGDREKTKETVKTQKAKESFCVGSVPIFWEGDAAKHFSVKKGVFSEKGGRQFSELGVWQGFLQDRQFSEEARAIQ